MVLHPRSWLYVLFAGICTTLFGACFELTEDERETSPDSGMRATGADAGPDHRNDGGQGAVGDGGDVDLNPDAGGLVDSGQGGGLSQEDGGPVEDSGFDAGSLSVMDGGANATSAFYSATRIHSPINEAVVNRLIDIYNSDLSRADDVFLKAGASSTVSSRTLHCFAGDDVELGSASELQSALDYFLMGEAADSTPFDRETVAALSGHSAGWVISGDPSPIQEEINMINPRFGFVHFGTNDMGLGLTYATAMPNFYDNMMELFTLMVEQGVIPLVFGISPRLDSTNADKWVDTYNALIRGMAQAHQVPFIDLHLATLGLVNYGMASDGIHLNYFADGACILNAEGLEYGYNVRNLIALEVLDRMMRYVVEDEELPGDASPSHIGLGTAQEPWLVHELPYGDYSDTRLSVSSELDSYVGCDSAADESGPEWIYRLVVDEVTPIRALVMDGDDVDIDIHLLGADISEASCLMRGHRFIEATLEPGTYHFVLDSWVDANNDVKSGEYLFAVVPCRDDDTDCSVAVSP